MSPRFSLREFLSQYKFSALTTRQTVIAEFYLLLTFSRYTFWFSQESNSRLPHVHVRGPLLDHSDVTCSYSKLYFCLFISISLIMMADEPQRARLSIPPSFCNVAIVPVNTKDLPLAPSLSPYEFLSRCKSSILTTR